MPYHNYLRRKCQKHAFTMKTLRGLILVKLDSPIFAIYDKGLYPSLDEKGPPFHQKVRADIIEILQMVIITIFAMLEYMGINKEGFLKEVEERVNKEEV